MYHDQFGTPGQTQIHPAVLAALILVGLLILVLPRRYALMPALVMSLITPMGQVLMIGFAHFTVIRILVAFCWTRLIIQRVLIEGRDSKLRFNAIDWSIIGYGVTSIICYTLLWQQFAAFNNQAGIVYNVLGVYFACRYFIRDREDIDRAIKTLAVTAAFIALCMINEQVTGLNALAIFGGLPLFTAVRAGYLRSQGPFEVYLTAGAFGATLLPLFLTLYRRHGSRVFGLIGLIAGISITITSQTSTAISTGLATVFGILFWRFRKRMSLVRWTAALGLTAMHLVMKAPVWALLARIDIVGGSTGWHRFMIIDNCIRHFQDWFLFGAKGFWTWEGGDDMWDLANAYVKTAETTGLVPFIFFIAVIAYGFKRIGIARKAVEGDTSQEWFLWLLGVSLFANSIAFIGISYFDQTGVYWYLLVALYVTATERRNLESQQETPPIPASRSELDWYRPVLEQEFGQIVR